VVITGKGKEQNGDMEESI